MEKIFSIESLKGNKIPALDAIIIPDWILDCMMVLCNHNIEYSGQLLCYKKIVEYPFIAASGSLGSVFPTKKITFNDSPDYSEIEFHTHPAALGSSWATKFSSGDLTTFNNRIVQRGEQYQHVLFTHVNVLTWGKHNAPDIRVGFGSPDVVVQNFNKWNDKYHSWAPVPKMEPNKSIP